MRSKALKYALAGIAASLAVGLSIDLFGSRHSDLRQFDPDEVARIETAMWRSYYERHEARMFFQLAELLRTQYQAPLIRSNVLAFRAARAAFIFKGGKQRRDYERALPDLIAFYAAVRRMSMTPFDVEPAARAELEWWILHREREQYGRAALDRSLAGLQSVLYRLPVERFMEHGQLRAEAMVLRDARWEAGKVDESDWTTIQDLLRRSWRSLWTEVHANGIPDAAR